MNDPIFDAAQNRDLNWDQATKVAYIKILLYCLLDKTTDEERDPPEFSFVISEILRVIFNYLFL